VGIRTLVDVRNQSLARERLIAILAAAFAGLGLVLTAIGIYGLVNHSVSRRTAEIGIRMALGADRRKIVRLIAGNAMALVLWGAIAGVPAAWAVNRAVAALVYRGVSFGPIPTGLAVVLMLLAAVTSLWLPLRRATRVDPLQALRSE
jgi:ABC-type antimicrobial peptide transport system permease subunit